jgi:hypothetical protein
MMRASVLFGISVRDWKRGFDWRRKTSSFVLFSWRRYQRRMSALFRARASSFLAGMGVSTLACMVSLKQDIENSYSLVMDAVRLGRWPSAQLVAWLVICSVGSWLACPGLAVTAMQCVCSLAFRFVTVRADEGGEQEAELAGGAPGSPGE